MEMVYWVLIAFVLILSFKGRENSGEGTVGVETQLLMTRDFGIGF